MKKLIVYTAFFLSFNAFVVINVNDLKKTIHSALATYSQTNWPEKVYIQTDKSYYIQDESIWFTTYLVNGITHLKSNKSTVIYVELINNDGTILDKKRLYIKDLTASGDFKIDKSWPEGSYYIRAYTKYMQYEDPSVFFKKKLHVVSVENRKPGIESKSNKSITSAPHSYKPELRFYPEGGFLINNLTNKVAIKFHNESFQSNGTSIKIVNSKDEVLTEFSVLKYGLGVFYITPEATETYFALINIKSTTYKYRLPKPLPQGYTLNTNFTKDDLLIQLSSNVPSGLKGTYLVVHQRGKLLYDAIETQDIANNLIKISTRMLQDGVTNITLFNSEGRPVCERLVYISNPSNKAKIELSSDAKEYGTREKVVLKIKTKDFKQTIVPSSLSLSVRDVNALPYDSHTQNIKSWLLLNSDLRGRIEDPGFFFTETAGRNEKFLLDLIMMTNGWRRFTWQKLLYEQSDHNIDEIEKGLFISGTTTLLNSSNDPVRSINTLSFMGSTVQELKSKTSDKNGNFRFGPLIYYDSIQAIIQSRIINPDLYNNTNYRDVLITINQEKHISPEVEYDKNTYVVRKDTVINSDFIETSKNIQKFKLEYEHTQRLDEVVLTGQTKTKLKAREAQMAKRSFFNTPTRRIDIASDTFLSVTQLPYLFLRFPGVAITGMGPTYRGELSKLILDNILVDYRDIRNIEPSSISFIEFYAGAEAALYSRSTGGVFVIYTKLGGDTNDTSERKPGIINFKANGFYTAKEFYAPDYSKSFDEYTGTDIRTTLHWEPEIIISKDEDYEEISFYTCDMKGDYVIEVEGLTKTGIPVHQTSFFTVN